MMNDYAIHNGTEALGMVYVFTGNGKGKTSAGLGVALRALAAGLKVAIVQWYKDPAWRISEHEISKLLTPEANNRFAIYPMGVGFHIKTKTAPLTTGQVVVDKATQEEHAKASADALKKAESLLPIVDVLILDEVNNAVDDGLMSPISLIRLINHRYKTHLILTGRNAHKDVIDLADLVTEMTKIKHPYDNGKLAIKGLDF
jgi:cob(I)alamin adenosyltransferase